MIAKNVLEIGAADFLAGMTSGRNTSDGGFTTDTDKLNILTVPGVLYQPSAMIDRTTNLINGNVVASCGDAVISSIGNDKNFVTDTGYFYTYQSTTLTQRQTGAKTYQTEDTDIIQFRTDTFITSTTNIARLVQSNLSQPDGNWESWWTITKGKSALTSGFRHPMVVFENSLWIADGNKLHKWDGTTATEAFLTLSTEQAIISLGVDPSSGKMLISINESFNASDTKSSISKVLVYNGYSNKPDKAVIVDDMVTSIYPLGGTVFMCYGQSLGYWNGIGITFLRRFKYVDLIYNNLVYKQRITSIGQTLYIADGVGILAYGEVTPGKKIFYYAQKVTNCLQTYLTGICYLRGISTQGGRELGLFYEATDYKKLVSFNVDLVTGTINNGTYYSKLYRFPRPIVIREITVEYDNAVSNNTTPGTIAFNDEFQAAYGFGAITNTSGASEYSHYTRYSLSRKFKSLQLIYSSSLATGIRRFLIGYDFVE